MGYLECPCAGFPGITLLDFVYVSARSGIVTGISAEFHWKLVELSGILLNLVELNGISMRLH